MGQSSIGVLASSHDPRTLVSEGVARGASPRVLHGLQDAKVTLAVDPRVNIARRQGRLMWARTSRRVSAVRSQLVLGSRIVARSLPKPRTWCMSGDLLGSASLLRLVPQEALTPRGGFACQESLARQGGLVCQGGFTRQGGFAIQGGLAHQGDLAHQGGLAH